MKNQEIKISLEEYKELLLDKDNQLRDIEKMLLDKIMDYIREHIKYEKDSWSSVKGLRFSNFEEKELLNIIRYIDSYRFYELYKYATDKDYKEKQDALKMERLRDLKELKKEVDKEDE